MRTLDRCMWATYPTVCRCFFFACENASPFENMLVKVPGSQSTWACSRRSGLPLTGCAKGSTDPREKQRGGDGWGAHSKATQAGGKHDEPGAARAYTQSVQQSEGSEGVHEATFWEPKQQDVLRANNDVVPLGAPARARADVQQCTGTGHRRGDPLCDRGPCPSTEVMGVLRHR